MADIPLDEQHSNPNPESGAVDSSKVTDKKEVAIPPQPPKQIQVVDGNTGSLTVQFLDAIVKQNIKILAQLKEMNYYLSFLEVDKDEDKED